MGPLCSPWQCGMAGWRTRRASRASRRRTSGCRRASRPRRICTGRRCAAEKSKTRRCRLFGVFTTQALYIYIYIYICPSAQTHGAMSCASLMPLLSWSLVDLVGLQDVKIKRYEQWYRTLCANAQSKQRMSAQQAGTPGNGGAGGGSRGLQPTQQLRMQHAHQQQVSPCPRMSHEHPYSHTAQSARLRLVLNLTPPCASWACWGMQTSLRGPASSSPSSARPPTINTTGTGGTGAGNTGVTRTPSGGEGGR